MAQASSAYSTSGTQYNATNSYYLLDSVPGSGDAIPGPVTITAAPPAVALTVAGNTVATGAVGVSGVLNAAGGLLTNAIGAGTAGPGGLLELTSGGALNVTGGIVNVVASASDAVFRSVGPGATTKISGAQVSVLNPNGGGMRVNQGETLFGFNCQFNEKTDLQHGLSMKPGMGTYAAPATATAAAPGAYTFTMTGNKAFVTTGAGAFELIVLLPLNGLSATCDWTALITQIGVTATNVTTVTQNGGISLILANAAITTPITVAITLL